MENFIIYAPCALFIITLIIQLGIFARSSDLASLEAKLLKHISIYYVTDKTYRENHKTLQDQLQQIHTDINDIKNLLISQKGG